MLYEVITQNNLFGIITEHLFFAVSKKPLREFIEKSDCTLRGHPQDDAVGIFHQFPVFSFAFSNGGLRFFTVADFRLQAFTT